MSLDYAVAQIMSRLTDWAGLPKYQLERRVDIFLTPFLEAFLSQTLKVPVRMVAPEFPILSDLRALGAKARRDDERLTARTVNADYLLLVEDDTPYWLLLELKTDADSFEPEQADLYAIARSRGMPELLKDLELVESRTEVRHEWKYRRLRARLPRPDAAGQRIAVGYLGPSSLEPEVLSYEFPPDGADATVHPPPSVPAVNAYFSLSNFAGQPVDSIPAEVRPLWPYVRDLLRTIDSVPDVRTRP